MELKQHPLSAAFPSMSSVEYDALCKSIVDNGLLNPIVIYQGMVIDGWHRYRACLDEMIATKTIELASDVDPQAYVIAQNKDRRHLTQSQIATAAIKVYEWLKDGVKQGLQASSAPSAEVKSSKEIAELVGVSTKTVDEAKKVEKQATPEVKEAVAKGEMSVSTAVKQMAKENATPKDTSNKYDILQETINSLQETLNELTKNLEDAIAENETLLKAFEADDKLAEALAEAKKYRELFAIERRMKEGEVNAKNEYIKKVKSLERQLAKVQRA